MQNTYSSRRLFLLLTGIVGAWLLNFPPLHAAEQKTSHHATQASEPTKIMMSVDATPAIRLRNAPTIKNLIPELGKKQVIYVGEIHTRYDHHLLQLEIIRQLHALHPDLAIGMEYFQQPYQQHLDAYIHGDLDEREMLSRTEYYDRWRYDYRLYAPILRYAREHGISLVALNLPMELTQKVSREGLDSLTETERAQIPRDIDRSDKEYAQRLEKIFKQHPEGQASDFERFLTVQLLWDEGMAQAIVDYLTAHPATHMVVLAGSGHLAYGSGIPNRVTRRMPLEASIILNNWEDTLDTKVADIMLLSQEQELPKAGKLGASLDEDKDKGMVKLEACMPDSPCEKTGLKTGDQILSINGETITSMAALRVTMWDKLPGDEIKLTIRRKHWFAPAEELSYHITLQ
ncbi:ChaN family lipoprotein [Kaarinaea lacus]